MINPNKRTDQTLHGMTADGAQIVYYSRGGQWYIEPEQGKRRRVLVGEAATLAADGTAIFNVDGGQIFEARVRRLMQERQR